MRKIKIGVPRALFYYKQFSFWKTFFQMLGADVIVSPQTNAQILNRGVEVASSEICLPVKVFFGHALDLADKCDFVFVPRIVSVEKSTYTCPKFLGLPDMLKALPEPITILSADFNAKKKDRYFYKSLYELAAPINKNPVSIYKAYKEASKAIKIFHQKKLEGNLTYDILNESGVKRDKELKIGVVGHPYNVYDPYISLNFLERLKKQKISIKTLENVPPQKIEEQVQTLPKAIYWSYEKEVVGTVMHWLHSKAVDGIIYLLAFACGPDSLMQVVIENEAQKNQDVPLMSLVIDEHSGEAGFLTRLEAFIDMLKYKKAKLELI